MEETLKVHTDENGHICLEEKGADFIVEANRWRGCEVALRPGY